MEYETVGTRYTICVVSESLPSPKVFIPKLARDDILRGYSIK